MSVLTLTKRQKILSWILQATVAVILFQTLFFKFTAAPESVYIFQKVGLEPLGRIGSGLVELIAVVFLLWPRKVWLGALIGFIVISGAIFFHLTTLGIVVKEDSGFLFYLAVTVFLCCSGLLIIHRDRMISDIENVIYGNKER